MSVSAPASAELSHDEIQARIRSVPFWYHRIEVAPGIVTPGIDRSQQNLQRMNLPADLAGQRVLDIGAFDGFYSFECERRGAAEVIAIDGNPATGLPIIRDLLGSRVQFHTIDVYDLTPEAFGQFDLVLCLGVLYHLRHLLLGLERIHAVCRGQLILETQVCDEYFLDASGMPWRLADIAPALLPVPIVQFYPSAEFNQDATSWWSPNIAALHGILRSVGFEPFQTIPNGQRAYIHCRRVDAPPAREWVETAPATEPLPERTPRSAVPTATLEEPHRPASPSRASEPDDHSDRVLLTLLAQALHQQSEQMQDLQRILVQRDAQIADLEARARWLDDQSRSARAALGAVEQGRVLRLLRWLSRR